MINVNLTTFDFDYWLASNVDITAVRHCLSDHSKCLIYKLGITWTADNWLGIRTWNQKFAQCYYMEPRYNFDFDYEFASVQIYIDLILLQFD